MKQGGFKWHQYQVVGRLLPDPVKDPEPTVYRMKIWAQDAVRARSRFWYFLSRFRKAKKANGQILAVNEIFERHPTATKNYGIWLRYQSRTGYHNMYKEYRDLTLNGAIEQMYTEMASRHRVRSHQLHIIKTMSVKAKDCKRENVVQYQDKWDNDKKEFDPDGKVKFPVVRRYIRPESRKYKTTFKAARPSVACF